MVAQQLAALPADTREKIAKREVKLGQAVRQLRRGIVKTPLAVCAHHRVIAPPSADCGDSADAAARPRHNNTPEPKLEDPEL